MTKFIKKDIVLRQIYKKEKHNFHKLNICPVCNSKKIKFKLKNWLINLYICEGCKHVFANPMPSDKFINEYYKHNPYIQDLNLDFLNKRFNDKKKYFYYFFNKDVKNKIWLDVGSGCGELLFLAKFRGYTVLSNELQQNLKDYQKKFFGINNFIDDINKLKDNSINVISMIHVLEHLVDVNKIIQLIYKKLDKKGKLILEIPNQNYFLFPSYKMNRLTNLHLHDFSMNSLKILLEQTNFKIKYLGLNPFFVQVSKNRIKNIIAKCFFLVNKLFKKIIGNKDHVILLIAEK